MRQLVASLVATRSRLLIAAIRTANDVHLLSCIYFAIGFARRRACSRAPTCARTCCMCVDWLHVPSAYVDATMPARDRRTHEGRNEVHIRHVFSAALRASSSARIATQLLALSPRLNSSFQTFLYEREQWHLHVSFANRNYTLYWQRTRTRVQTSISINYAYILIRKKWLRVFSFIILKNYEICAEELSRALL